MKAALLFTLALALLTGCATAPHQVWYQPGKTPAETWQAYNTCQLQASQTADPFGLTGVGGGGWSPGMRIRNATKDLVSSGMRAKGYTPTIATQTLSDNYPPSP